MDDYRAVVESIPHLVWVAGPDGAVEYLNGRCLEYVGRPMGKLLGWDWGRVVHPDDLSTVLGYVCNGAQGVPGADGADGTNGTNGSDLIGSPCTRHVTLPGPKSPGSASARGFVIRFSVTCASKRTTRRGHPDCMAPPWLSGQCWSVPRSTLTPIAAAAASVTATTSLPAPAPTCSWSRLSLPVI